MDLLRDAFRAARNTPVVSSVAVLSLALGIGANTSTFSILNSLLLKPLPVREPNELVVVDSAGPGEWYGVGYPIWREIRDRRVFEQAFAWGTDRVGLSTAGEIRFATAIWASGDIFDVLGVSAAFGRTFDGRDDVRGGGPGGPVGVISHPFWQRRFGGAPDAIGRTLAIEGVPYTVVGVMPPRFFGPTVGETFDVMLPLATEPLIGRKPPRLESPMWTWLHIMARRAPGQTATSLTAALGLAQPDIREATMPSFTRSEDRDRYLRAAWVVRDAPGGVSRLRRQYGPALQVLLAVVAVVLLVACANIAALMLGRSTARRHEFSVRLALGASRARLVRQFLVESLLLSAAGALLGLLLAHWSSRILVAQLSTWASAAFLDLAVDRRVLAATAATTVVTAILFGTLPSYRAVRCPAIDALKGPRGSGAASSVTMSGLLVVQVALSLVLVIGAALFVRSFAGLAYRDIGFDRNRVLVAVLDARRTAVPASERGALYERVREVVATVPGIEHAATSLATPLGSAGVRFTPEISAPDNPVFGGKSDRILTTPVSPGWFDTFGTRLLAGRDFDDRDRAGAPGVVIINEAFARRYFGGGTPLGRTLIEGSAADRRSLEIVGLVEDAAFTTVRGAVEPTLYKPLAQRLDEKLLTSMPSISVSVRAASGLSPEGLTSSVAAAISGVDRDLAVTFLTLSEQLRIFYIRERLLAMLSGFFGALALLLAAIGLYSVVAYLVSQRRPEIGIRMALGADRRRILSMILGRVLTLTVMGVAVGTLLSVWAAGLVRTLLYATDARDPVTFVGASLVLLAVSSAAAWLPARRAARIDPAIVLRET
jgi:putative ABC transport system permease protein